MERGYSSDRCLEELCVSNPEVVSTIHKEYIAAGARLIETNSFGANAIRLSKYGLEERASEFACAAAKLAVDAARGSDVAVAGSVGPLGIVTDQAKERGIDRRTVFRDQMTGLFATALLLVLVVTLMNVVAIVVRNRLRRKYATSAV